MDTPAATVETETEQHPYDARRARQLAVLDRLEAMGMNLAERIDRVSSGTASEAEAQLFADRDIVQAFTRVARAVRQVIVLSQETMGFRAPPSARGAGAGRGASGSHAGPHNPRDPSASDDRDHEASDYDDYNDEERREQWYQEERELSQLIYQTLAELRDAMPGPDEKKPRSPKEACEFDWERFILDNGGTLPPTRAPPE